MPNNRSTPQSTIHISELHLRVPGMSRVDAQRLGEQVAEHLSRGAGDLSRGAMRPARDGNIGSLHVRMSQQSGRSSDRLARSIAENILRRIG